MQLIVTLYTCNVLHVRSAFWSYMSICTPVHIQLENMSQCCALSCTYSLQTTPIGILHNKCSQSLDIPILVNGLHYHCSTACHSEQYGCHQTVHMPYTAAVISACADLMGTNYYQATIRQTSGVPTITLSCVPTSRDSLVEVRERTS